MSEEIPANAIRDEFKEILSMIDLLNREEEERVRSGLHPLFGLGEPLLTLQRTLGAAIEARDDELLEKEGYLLIAIHSLLNLMRSTRGQLPEDVDSLQRIVGYFSIGVERLDSKKRPDNCERVQAVTEDIQHVIVGLRRRIDIINEYFAIPLPQ